MAATSSSRKQSVQVDLCGRPPLPLPDDTANRTLLALGQFLDLIEELEKLLERDLSPSVRREDRRDLSLLEPAVERRRADAEKSCRIDGPHSGSCRGLEELSNVGDLVPRRRINAPFQPAEPPNGLNRVSRFVEACH